MRTPSSSLTPLSASALPPCGAGLAERDALVVYVRPLSEDGIERHSIPRSRAITCESKRLARVNQVSETCLQQTNGKCQCVHGAHTKRVGILAIYALQLYWACPQVVFNEVRTAESSDDDLFDAVVANPEHLMLCDRIRDGGLSHGDAHVEVGSMQLLEAVR